MGSAARRFRMASPSTSMKLAFTLRSLSVDQEPDPGASVAPVEVGGSVEGKATRCTSHKLVRSGIRQQRVIEVVISPDKTAAIARVSPVTSRKTKISRGNIQ